MMDSQNREAILLAYSNYLPIHPSPAHRLTDQTPYHAQRVGCPKCDAAIGESCVSLSGARKTLKRSHNNRIKLSLIYKPSNNRR